MAGWLRAFFLDGLRRVCFAEAALATMCSGPVFWALGLMFGVGSSCEVLRTSPVGPNLWSAMRKYSVYRSYDPYCSKQVCTAMNTIKNNNGVQSRSPNVHTWGRIMHECSAMQMCTKCRRHLSLEMDLEFIIWAWKCA